MQKFWLILLLSFVAFSCDNSEGPSEELDQEELLSNIGDNIIVKAYENLNSESISLEEAAKVFTSNLTAENLILLRDEWKDAYVSWQKTAIFDFGPAENYALVGLNLYPTDTDLIDNYISTGNYNLNTAGASFAKGFPAVDYLLFGTGNSDTEILAYFESNANAANFLLDVVANMQELIGLVYNEWLSSYSEVFRTNTGTSTGSSLSLLVNGWSKYMEIHVRNAKLGTPNGNSVVTDQRFGPFPEKSEAYYSRIYTTEFIQTTLNSIRKFYLGEGSADGEGIYDYLIKLNAQDGTLADDFLALMVEAETGASSIDPVFLNSLEGDGAEVTQVFNTMKSLIAILKVDVVSALSISITYADNDGD